MADHCSEDSGGSKFDVGIGIICSFKVLPSIDGVN